MKERDAELHHELWEPYEALKAILDLTNMSQERVAAINDGLIADLLGEASKPTPPSTLSREAINLHYSIMGTSKNGWFLGRCGSLIV